MKLKIFFLALAAASILMLTGCGAHEGMSESMACEMINEQIASDPRLYKAALGDEVNSCERVEIQRKISFGKWRARAYFNNGAEMDCIIENLIFAQQVQPDNGSVRRGK